MRVARSYTSCGQLEKFRWPCGVAFRFSSLLAAGKRPKKGYPSLALVSALRFVRR